MFNFLTNEWEDLKDIENPPKERDSHSAVIANNNQMVIFWGLLVEALLNTLILYINSISQIENE